MTELAFGIRPEDIKREEVWFAMGYRDAVPDENVRAIAEELIAEIAPCVTARYMYRFLPAQKLSGTRITLDGKEFCPGGIIASYLDGMTEACVFVATAGLEFNAKLKEINSRGDIVADFVADSIGSVLAEMAVGRMEKDIAAIKGTVSLCYSPGYCGWDIREQQQFFTLFPPEPCGIHLSESSLMYPEKSVSGFAAMGPTLVRQPYHCEICKNSKCFKRRKG